jgi:hypothetical protein
MGWVEEKTGINLGDPVSTLTGGKFSLEEIKGGLTGETAAESALEAGRLQSDAAIQAAQIQADVQREAMALGAPFRKIELEGAQRLGGLAEQALPQFQALTGLGGAQAQMAAEQAITGSPAQQALKERAARLSTRSASAIGGLGGGNIRRELFEQGGLLDLQAIMQRRQQLGNLVNRQPGAGSTQFGAGQLSQLGGIQAGGILGGAQAQASGLLGASQAQAQAFQNLLGFGGMAAGAAISDRRLKTNVHKVGEFNGMNIYDYSYIWGGPRQRGVMAQEILNINPGAVITMDNGYLAVDYRKL